MLVTLVLCVVVVVALGGCACVVWASRGGPRWARAVGAVTLALGEVVRRGARSRGRSGRGSNDSGSSD
ncbi:hypothetical protein ABT160_16715 [Streptomyces sp. NPDC001941]|uniref:hypothetical protein n=1 Tax=Streptomyces sp. NPDC001941 TaxID=3154659 RepID=UPI003329687A